MASSIYTGPTLSDRVKLAFGRPADSMSVVELRAIRQLPDYDVIAWEVDATNFRFQYVSASAERLLGHPASLWITDPAFWVEKVIWRGDIEEAVSALALCTGKGTDQDFRFRAMTADGRLIPFHAFACAVIGRRGVAARVRGLMLTRNPAGRAASPGKTPGEDARTVPIADVRMPAAMGGSGSDWNPESDFAI